MKWRERKGKGGEGEERGREEKEEWKGKEGREEFASWIFFGGGGWMP